MSNHKKQETESSFLMWIRSELSQRMVQNLPFIKIEPENILLDQPISTSSIVELQKIYPKAQWSANFKQKRTLKEKLLFLVLPKVTSNSLGTKFDLIWSCHTLLKKEVATEQLTSHWEEIMSDNGLLMMAYLGPDTVKEYHHFLAEKLPIIDMHDLGDLLVHSGFSDPVMTMEYVTLEYDNSTMLQKELRALLGPLMIENNSENLMQEFAKVKTLSPNGKWQLTLEIVYGHAWKVPKMKNNVVTIDAKSIKTKKK